MPPVSAQFDVLDWNPRAATAADGSALAGAPGSGVVALSTVLGSAIDNNEYAAFFALAKNAGMGVTVTKSQLLAEIPTSDFTLEVEFQLTEDTPQDCSDVAHRIFISANNYGYRGAGFLVTKRGLYLASTYDEATPSHLAGTDKYFLDEQGVPQRIVIRALVDNTNNRLALYVGPAEAVYDSTNGAQWWLYPSIALQHNVAAKADSDAPDGIRIVLSAPAGKDATLVLYGLRLATTLLAPIVRPTAVIEADWQMGLASATVLSGQNSYDKYGSAVTYDWTIENAPAGSVAKLQGATRATATTVVGVATASDVVFTYLPYTSLGNNWDVVIVDPGTVNAALTLSISGNTLRISCATGGGGALTTTAASLLLAFSSNMSGAYNDAVATLFSVDLSAPLLSGTGVLVPGTYTFSGGTGSALATPLFIPDLVGPYVVSLRVANSTVTSPKVLSTISVTATDELHGEIPESDYIFKYLPDFWKAVKDREQLAVAWSAINQVITSDLVQAWQNDYAKSIRDIGREYQRRWLQLPNKTEAGSNYISSFASAAGDIDDVVATTALPVAGYSNRTATINVAYAKAPLAVGPVLYRATDFPPSVLNVAGVTAVGATWVVSAGIDAFHSCHRVTGGGALRAGVTASSVTDPAHNMRYETKVGDVVRATSALGAALTATIASYALEGVEAVTAAAIGLGASDRATWEVIRPVTSNRLTRTPYFVFTSGLLAADIAFGDVAVIGLLSPYTSVELSIPCTVLALTDTTLFVDLQPVLTALTTESLLEEHPVVWSYATLSQLAVAVTHFVRSRNSVALADLTKIPALGTTTLAAEYLMGRDYTVQDSRVHITDLARGTATTNGTPDIAISDVATWYSLPPLFTLYELDSFGVRALLIETGVDAGLHAVVGKSGSTVSLATPLLGTETPTFAIPRHSSVTPAPNSYWAEVAFFDNWRTIQGNFGLMVGLPKQYLTNEGIEVDYLTIVRSLCFTFVAGPTLGNLALVADAFIGVPFLEHAGQVLRIVEPTTTEDGYLVVRDQFGRDIHHRYPVGTTLAENPTTQNTIAAYPLLVERPDKLSAAEKALYDDAVLPANSRLFIATQVDDYISNPGVVEAILTGENIITKYHTFIVRVPLEIAKTTAAMSLIKTYLTEAKAAYTRFLLFGTMLFTDDIDVEDILEIEYTLMLKDTPHSALNSYNTVDPLSAAGVSLVYPSLPMSDDYLSTKAFADGAYTTLVDATERYESGYQEGVLDDLSGDGSMNVLHGEQDRVNQFDFDDIDVCSSYLWMPITKNIAGAMAGRDFVIGEEVVLQDTGVTILASDDYVWPTSPPVIVHIGCGAHLETPHAYSPQYMHPDTYLILGFHRPATVAGLSDPAQVLTNYGTEKRLDGWYIADQVAVGAVTVYGLTSGAEGALGTAPDRKGVAADQALYWVVRMNQLDKLNEYNLKDAAVIQQTAYLPFTVLHGGSGLLLDGTLADVTTAFGAATLTAWEAQTQMRPYDSSLADNLQFVPATAAGMYTNWLGAIPADTFQFGYDDVGPLSVTPTAINAFVKNPANSDVENTHVGLRYTRAGGWHYTHGFVTYEIPKPIVKLCSYAAGFARVEGNFFIAPDATATTYTSTPLDYDGTYSGSWVFARQGAAETFAAVVTFEEGLVPATTVLGLDGALQTATGHVLTAFFAPPLAAGVYDIIVRQYRPYEIYPGSGRLVHMDESIITGVVV